MLQPILIDSSDFAEIRENGCIYIDKTAYFHELITRRDARRFFLSRPRRFGKSLMITTLKAIFEGRLELFDGLAISKTDWKWEKYHVMHFNFMRAATSIPEEFKSLFELEVRRGIVKAGGTYDPQQSAAGNFGNAIEELFTASKGKGVVVLIDEYDAPVARLLDKLDDADKIRGMLADFYGQMKDRTPCIRFLMITGVSRFTKMSMFSALSNLINLSMVDQYATMLGYTEEELDKYFGDHLRAHAEKMKLSDDKYRAELKRWFNGYRFGQTLPATVYNPVSIGINLSERNSFFKASWAETGKASMLMNSVTRDDLMAIDLRKIQYLREEAFDVTDIRNLKPIPMLYQAGYLTIADYDDSTRRFALRVPDEEVRQDLSMLMTSVAAHQDVYWVSELGNKLLDAEWDSFFIGLKALYADLPYGPLEGNVQEYSFERNLLVLLWALNIRCDKEVRQSNGQADVVAVSAVGVFIFELKVDESADEALKQVKDKHYDTPYQGRNLPIWLIGLNFDRKTRHLLDAKVERV